MMDIDEDFARGGYYAVYVEEDGIKAPRVVFANSAFQAAHKIMLETGQLPKDTDVEGPYDSISGLPPAVSAALNPV